MTTRPNILFICTDQQRFDSLGCYGNGHIHTPAIDRLAADGVLFERCYVQSPVCAPSRASLVTGQYPHNHGLWANGVSLSPHHELISRQLASAGYTCGMIGKMHLAACYAGRTEPRQPDDGYAYYKWAHDPSHGSPENDFHRWLADRHPDLLKQAQSTPGGFDAMPTKAHYSHWASERALEFLDTQPGQNDDPFFLWVNFYDPHHPFVAPQEYLDRYDPEALPDPVGFPGELASKPPVQQEASNESYAGYARGFSSYEPAEIREIIRTYYAMISLIDDEVQRILERLDALGFSENTIVIFTSDHGEMLGDHQLLLKGPMMYEPAVRVPLIMRWPGYLPAGSRIPDIVQWIDLNPTFSDLAGLEPLPGAQGASLLPLARGDAGATSRGWAICEYTNSGHPYDSPVVQTMLRTGDHKLVVQHGQPAAERPRTGELYDLQQDPDELVNLWDDLTSARIRIALEQQLLDILVATANRAQPRDAFW
jgi:arylsulfatase A-like enzyme